MSLKQMKIQTGFALSAEEYAIAVDAGVKRGMQQLVQSTERYCVLVTNLWLTTLSKLEW